MLITELRPDLVLFDLVMPELGGLEVCRCIRISESCRHNRIGIISDLADPTMLEAVRARGVEWVLRRPDPVVELFDILDQVQRDCAAQAAAMAGARG